MEPVVVVVVMAWIVVVVAAAALPIVRPAFAFYMLIFVVVWEQTMSCFFREDFFKVTK